MRLAVDANILVAEALRTRGRALLAHPWIDLFLATETWSETEHELRKRVALLVRYGHLEAEPAEQLLDDALAVIGAHVTLTPPDLYDDRMDEARRRIPRDPLDAPSVALALTLDAGIWTLDQDFFGCGIATWITETLMAHLAATYESDRETQAEKNERNDV